MCLRLCSRVCAALVATAVLATTWDARAQDLASQQFDYGLAEMLAGRYETGCPALADSYRLDPRPGALFTVAECESKWGRIASALAHYDAYLGLVSRMSPEQKATQRDREVVATEQRAALAKRVPELTITLAPSVPQGTTVTRDGLVLAGPSLGAAMPVDPGDHVVVATTPAGKRHEQRVQLSIGEHKMLNIDFAEVTARPPSPPPATEPSSAAQPGDSPTPRATPPRTWVWVAGGVGVVGVAVGTVSGLMTLGKKSTIDAHCRDTVCDSNGAEAADSAKTFGALSTISFAVGAAGLATAAIVFLLESRGAPGTARAAWRPVASADAHGATVGLHARW